MTKIARLLQSKETQVVFVSKKKKKKKKKTKKSNKKRCRSDTLFDRLNSTNSFMKAQSQADNEFLSNRLEKQKSCYWSWLKR